MTPKTNDKPKLRLFGSLTNRLMEGPANLKPEIGMGMTELMYTDRHAGTVTWVSKSRKTLRWRADKAVRTDENFASESQSYNYFRQDGKVETDKIIRLNKHGQWVHKGTVYVLGIRDEYYDYSF